MQQEKPLGPGYLTICSITSWLKCSHCNFVLFIEIYAQIFIFFGQRENDSKFLIIKSDLKITKRSREHKMIENHASMQSRHFMYKKGRVNSNSRFISTDEDPSLRIESSAIIINLRGVSTKLNMYK